MLLVRVPLLFLLYFVFIQNIAASEENSKEFAGIADISLVGVQSNLTDDVDLYDNVLLTPSTDLSSLRNHRGAEEGSESILQAKQTHNAAVLDPSKTIVKGSIYDLIAGIVGNFTITPVDRNGKPMSTANLQLLLRHNMSEKHSKFVTHCEKQFCIVYYLCIEAGKYFMNLLLDNEHIGGSPFTITVHPNAVDASRTFAMALDNNERPVHPLLRQREKGDLVSWKWKAGESNIFTINPRDTYGNKIFNFNYRMLSFSHNLSLSSTLKMKSEILQDGRLKVSANTTSTTPFQLSIVYKETPILNSPIDVSVVPSDVSSEHSFVIGTGLIDSSVGKQSEIIVLVRDKWFNLSPEGFLSATCHSPNCSLAIENHRNGTFSVLFTPYKKEVIELSVRVNGFPITGSPFKIQVKGDDFPLPPLMWNFLGPFDWEDCLRVPASVIARSGLCDYKSFKEKVPVDPQVIYESALIKGGKVSWRTTGINAQGIARIKTTGSDFFGWAVGEFEVHKGGTYNVICEGTYEFYINDISFSGGSWHPIILEKQKYELTLLLSSMGGIGDFRCDFMPDSSSDTSLWPMEGLIDVYSLPGEQSWFALIQLVILFKCLEAILGPMYYYRQ